MVFAIILGFIIIGFSLWLYAHCGNRNSNVPETPEYLETSVEEAIIADHGYMDKHYKNYSWFETSMTLKEYLDCNSTSDKVVKVTSIFQVITAVGDGFDTKVILCETTPSSHNVTDKDAFWVGDTAMNHNQTFITLSEAYLSLMKSNYPKPHSKQVVLREELGPVRCNPQYIFGNITSHLYVDAVTGEVNIENPAFKGFECPVL